MQQINKNSFKKFKHKNCQIEYRQTNYKNWEKSWNLMETRNAVECSTGYFLCTPIFDS